MDSISTTLYLELLPRSLEHFHRIHLNFLSLSRTFLSWTSLYLKQKFQSCCNYSLPISNFWLGFSVIQVSYRISYKNTTLRLPHVLWRITFWSNFKHTRQNLTKTTMIVTMEQCSIWMTFKIGSIVGPSCSQKCHPVQYSRRWNAKLVSFKIWIFIFKKKIVCFKPNEHNRSFQ